MTQSVKRTIVEGVAWTATTTWLNKVIGIAYVLLVLSHLSVYEYGLTELVISIPPLLSLFGLPGLESVIMADMSTELGREKRARAKHLLTSYLSVRMLLGVTAWAVLFFSSHAVEAMYNESIATMVQIVSFSFLFGPLRSAYQVLFRVSLRFDLFSIHRVVEECAKLVTIAVCLLIFDLGPTAVAIGYISTDLVALPVFFPFFVTLWKKVLGGGVRSAGWLEPLSTLRDHGKWGIMGTYLAILSQNIRPWIIKFFLGTHAVGLFAVAMGMYQNTASLFPVTHVVAPVIPQYVDKRRSLYQLINSTIKYQCLANILAAAVMAVAMPVLIHNFFPSYADAYWLYIGFLVAMVPISFSGVFEATFFALKAQRNLFFANVSFILTVACVLPISIILAGFYGIAIELFATRVVYAVGRYVKLKQLLPEYTLNLKDMFTVSDQDRFLLQRLIAIVPPLSIIKRNRRK